MLDLRRWCITVGGNLVGFERSRVHIGGKPYLDRWIVYVGIGTLRLHKFWRGDDDRAPHDHPWPFVTFPLTTYYEKLSDETVREVKAWRLHFRPSAVRHIVLGSRYVSTSLYNTTWYFGRTDKPFYTLVITGPRVRGWGFWPGDKYARSFVPWRLWK